MEVEDDGEPDDREAKIRELRMANAQRHEELMSQG
jgi:hypothetical protein